MRIRSDLCITIQLFKSFTKWHDVPIELWFLLWLGYTIYYMPNQKDALLNHFGGEHPTVHKKEYNGPGFPLISCKTTIPITYLWIFSSLFLSISGKLSSSQMFFIMCFAVPVKRLCIGSMMWNLIQSTYGSIINSVNLVPYSFSL